MRLPLKARHPNRQQIHSDSHGDNSRSLTDPSRGIGGKVHASQHILGRASIWFFLKVLIVALAIMMLIPRRGTISHVQEPLVAPIAEKGTEKRLKSLSQVPLSLSPVPTAVAPTSTIPTKDKSLPVTGKYTNDKPIKVAYAISIIECTDHHKSGQSSVAGLQDASIVLRHSIHQNSIRNPSSGSRYDYEMYAIVHEQAQACAPTLQDAGFQILIKKPPILAKDIKGEYLKKNIHKEYCCGAHEFIKLYAYQIPAPLVVHLDIDFIFRKPMDAVFDVMLGASDEETRSRVEREDPTVPWPDNIEAMITRDYTSTYPGRKSGFQAGFWVLKPSQKHFDNLINIIREGDYVDGFQPANGWAGLGYGGFIGARAMQGLIAYYYDVHVPGTWVELNNCRYNAVRAVVIQRGKCLSGRATCEDCRTTNITDIYSIHYTACRKPWTCIAYKSNDPGQRYPRSNAMPVDIIDYDHCMLARRVWHEYRVDLESKLYELTHDEGIKRGQVGNYNRDYFLGHCTGDQSSGYLRLGGSPETIKRIPELYQQTN